MHCRTQYWPIETGSGNLHGPIPPRAAHLVDKSNSCSAAALGATDASLPHAHEATGLEQLRVGYTESFVYRLLWRLAVIPLVLNFVVHLVLEPVGGGIATVAIEHSEISSDAAIRFQPWDLQSHPSLLTLFGVGHYIIPTSYSPEGPEGVKQGSMPWQRCQYWKVGNSHEQPE